MAVKDFLSRRYVSDDTKKYGFQNLFCTQTAYFFKNIFYLYKVNKLHILESIFSLADGCPQSSGESPHIESIQ